MSTGQIETKDVVLGLASAVGILLMAWITTQVNSISNQIDRVWTKTEDIDQRQRDILLKVNTQEVQLKQIKDEIEKNHG